MPGRSTDRQWSQPVHGSGWSQTDHSTPGSAQSQTENNGGCTGTVVGDKIPGIASISPDSQDAQAVGQVTSPGIGCLDIRGILKPATRRFSVKTHKYTPSPKVRFNLNENLFLHKNEVRRDDSYVTGYRYENLPVDLSVPEILLLSVPHTIAGCESEDSD